MFFSIGITNNNEIRIISFCYDQFHNYDLLNNFNISLFVKNIRNIIKCLKRNIKSSTVSPQNVLSENLNVSNSQLKHKLDKNCPGKLSHIHRKTNTDEDKNSYQNYQEIKDLENRLESTCYFHYDLKYLNSKDLKIAKYTYQENINNENSLSINQFINYLDCGPSLTENSTNGQSLDDILPSISENLDIPMDLYFPDIPTTSLKNSLSDNAGHDIFDVFTNKNSTNLLNNLKFKSPEPEFEYPYTLKLNDTEKSLPGKSNELNKSLPEKSIQSNECFSEKSIESNEWLSKKSVEPDISLPEKPIEQNKSLPKNQMSQMKV
ncbi:hypothetical protein DMUE_2179 [Dictyocoela muelleri]|nr:hypothetical protein DMUE_2179 [Dictyocoela muelleri]